MTKEHAKKILITFTSATFGFLIPSRLKAEDPAPLYSGTIIGAMPKAVSYQNIDHPTEIDLKGTLLLPNAKGSARIRPDGGAIEIRVKLKGLEPTSKFGPRFLTYVLWALSPEGRLANLGELLIYGDQSRLNVTTQMQSFALIVSAEPYFAATEMSGVVVMENVLRDDTAGKVRQIRAKSELLPKNNFTLRMPAAGSEPAPDEELFYLRQARNAVQIAEEAGAALYAEASLKKAKALLRQAQLYGAGETEMREEASLMAREAVQTAEDARLIAVKRQGVESRPAADVEEPVPKTGSMPLPRAQGQTREGVKSEENTAIQIEVKEQLLRQLSAIAQAQDSPNGIIVSFEDENFDSGLTKLSPAAEDKLAKLSGILLAHPGLRIDAEAHMENARVSTPRIAEKCARTIRDYLIRQGIPEALITAQGFGKTRFSSASSDSQNRRARLDLVISGPLIGGNIN